MDLKKKIETQQKFIEELELNSQAQLRDENLVSQKAIKEIKEMNEKEMQRKQNENIKLTDLLNSWISR